MKKWILVFSPLLLVFTNNWATDSNTYSNKILMAVFAHSDDELMVSPILNKYAELGVKVYLVTVTDGSKGVTPHANIPAGDSLAKVRVEETACTAITLGINPPIQLGYEDGNLASMEHLFSLHKQIDSLFNQYKPDVVITFGPDGSYGHPDHRMVGNVVTEVVQEGKYAYPKQLLYIGFPNEVIESLPPLNTEIVNWYKKHLHTTQKEFLTYRIPYSEANLKTGREALGCCKSQFTPEVMDEIFVVMAQHKGLLYFRPWLGSNTIKYDIFE
ncbi:PIG-L deacetylase family protein [Flavobacteriaceae bacterium LMO-SS05]